MKNLHKIFGLTKRKRRKVKERGAQILQEEIKEKRGGKNKKG